MPKKTGTALRKLLRVVAANYVWETVTDKETLGMEGGAALTRTHVASDWWKLSVGDESNAFTAVRVPEWMRKWVVAPPLRAILVW